MPKNPRPAGPSSTFEEDAPFGAATSYPTPEMVRETRRRAATADRAAKQEFRDNPPAGHPAGAGSPGAGSPRSGARKPKASSWAPTNLARGKPVTKGGPAEEGAGVLLGLLAYALLFAFVDGGPAGVKRWLRAKFFNEGATGRSDGTAPIPASTAPQTGNVGVGATVLRHPDGSPVTAGAGTAIGRSNRPNATDLANGAVARPAQRSTAPKPAPRPTPSFLPNPIGLTTAIGRRIRSLL